MTVGLNCTVIAVDWPGFNVTGSAAPEKLKPAPDTVAPLIVTGEVPVDDKVTEYFAAVFTTTSPNAMLDELRLRVGVAAFNCSAKLFETPPAAAIRFTVCATWVDPAVAVNATLEAFVGMVTVAGTETVALLLDKATLRPPFGAGPLRVTLQASVPAPVMEAVLQESPFSTVLLFDPALPWP